MFIFHLSLPVRSSYDRLYNVIILGCNQSKWNLKRIVGPIAVVEQYVRRLTTVDDLKILNLKCIPSQRAQGGCNHRYTIVHNDKAVSVVREDCFLNFLIYWCRIFLPIAYVLVEDATWQLPEKVASEVLIVAHNGNEFIQR